MTWRRGVSKLGKDPQCVVPPSGRSPARRHQTLQCGVARSSQVGAMAPERGIEKFRYVVLDKQNATRGTAVGNVLLCYQNRKQASTDSVTTIGDFELWNDPTITGVVVLWIDPTSTYLAKRGSNPTTRTTTRSVY